MYKYKLTGINTNKKRFKVETNNFNYINSINCYKGNLWELMENGKYKKIFLIFN